MDQSISAYRSTMLETVAGKLKKNNFNVSLCTSKQEASRHILSLVPSNDTVGIGGSMSIQELGIADALKSRGHTIIQHTGEMSFEEGIAVRRRALTADVYMSSPNAITMTGELVFCDGIGNRAAAMIFGPRTIIAVAGFNKIVPDERAAWERIDYVAAPINVRRLKLPTPCSTSGTCAECASPDRICNIGVVIWKKPKYVTYHVVLVAEELGY